MLLLSRIIIEKIVSEKLQLLEESHNININESVVCKKNTLYVFLVLNIYFSKTRTVWLLSILK